MKKIQILFLSLCFSVIAYKPITITNKSNVAVKILEMKDGRPSIVGTFPAKASNQRMALRDETSQIVVLFTGCPKGCYTQDKRSPLYLDLPNKRVKSLLVEGAELVTNHDGVFCIPKASFK